MLALTLLVAVLIWFLLGVVRSAIRIWFDHQARLQHFENADAESPETTIFPVGPYENYRLTGMLLAIIGLAGVAAGWYLGHGPTAVGIYMGGIICAILGILIALLGVVFRSLAVPSESDAPGNADTPV